MQQGKDEISTKGNGKIGRGQIIIGPKPEKDKDDKTNGGDETIEIFLRQNQPKQSKVDQKKIAQNQSCPIPDAGKGEKVEGPANRDCADTKRSAGDCVVQFPCAFDCDGSTQKQNFEREKDCHRNQCLVSGEVLLAEKEITHPRDLYEHGPDRAENWQRSPVLTPGHGQQTYIEQGNVSK